MDRKWARSQAGCFNGLKPFDQFVAELPVLRYVSWLAEPADVYAVYTTLVIKGRSPRIARGSEFYSLQALRTGVANAADGSPEVSQCEYVVPVKAKSSRLRIATLANLFLFDGVAVDHVVLGIVDGDGSVSLLRIHNCIQPPSDNLQAKAGVPEPDVNTDDSD